MKTRVTLICLLSILLSSTALAVDITTGPILCENKSRTFEQELEKPTCTFVFDHSNFAFVINNGSSVVPIAFELGQTAAGQWIRKYTSELKLRSLVNALRELSNTSVSSQCQMIVCERVAVCRVSQTSDGIFNLRGNILYPSGQQNKNPHFYSANTKEELDTALRIFKHSGLCK